jgi:hypothetical protein
MNQKKSIMTLTATAIVVMLLISLYFGVFNFQEAQGSSVTYNPNSMTVPGVLSTDDYLLFPYLDKNLTIGFSKYGEMIDGITKTGLLYDGYDAFAPHGTSVPEWQWVSGWVLNITYEEGGSYMNVWAFALYSDYKNSSSIGGNWKEGVTGGALNLAFLGGRKTNGGAVTAPIQVLYNDARSFEALLNTTIYEDTSHQVPLVRLTFTIIFDKDTKQVIVLKDVKRLPNGKEIGDMQIEFGDRGEWDLGPSSGSNPPISYAHWFQNLPTVYNNDYQNWYNTTLDHYNGTYDVCQIISQNLGYVGYAAYWPKPIGIWVGSTQYDANRKIILSDLVTKTEVHAGSEETTIVSGTPTAYPQNTSAGVVKWEDDPMVFLDGQWQTEGVEYTWTSSTKTITWLTTPYPTSSDTVTIVYKENVTKTDMSSEPNSPFVIGEWAFLMTHAGQIFRGVTVYGVTDRNNADDANRVGNTVGNVLDSEVQYFLNETFNPIDLQQAVEKQDLRWVLDTYLTSATNTITLTQGMNKTDTLKSSGPNATATWSYAYARSEYWSAKLSTTALTSSSYAQLVIPYGRAMGYLTADSPNTFGFYALVTSAAKSGLGAQVYMMIRHYNSTGGIDYVLVSTGTNFTTSIPLDTWTWITPLGPATGSGNPEGTGFSWQLLSWNGGTVHGVAGDGSQTHCFAYYLQHGFANDIAGDVVIRNKNTYVVQDVYVDDVILDTSPGPVLPTKTVLVHSLEDGKILPVPWNEYNDDAERVLVNEVLQVRNVGYTINFVTGVITFATTLPAGTHVKVLYSTMKDDEIGRYEWIVVGSKAATVDSLGAAYVTEAFDSIKGIDVLKAGMDFRDTVYGPNVPYVCGYLGTVTKNANATNVRGDYYDSIGRSDLRDDWCTSVPVSSSNMIFVGGPRANLGEEYFNDFMSAFFAESEHVVNNTLGQANAILALTCWHHNVYTDNSTTGYGVISVYRDLNGTVGLVLWGLGGQDTYYVTQWFWNGNYGAGITAPDGTTVHSGIEYLQHENPGVTSIILQINYGCSPTNPTITIAHNERLGTISEKGQHDP